jgi:hypothetical protein
MLVACPTWPPLPNNTVELPQLEDSDSSPVSTMPPVEQSFPAMPYYSTSMHSTTMGTTPNDGWPLSSSMSLSIPDYLPYALGLTFNPAAATTYNPYVCNYLPTAVPTGMPPSSSASTANCTRPIDAFGAAPPPYDLHWVNDMQPVHVARQPRPAQGHGRPQSSHAPEAAALRAPCRPRDFQDGAHGSCPRR